VLNFNTTVNYGAHIGSFSLYNGYGTYVNSVASFVTGYGSWSTTNATSVGDYVISVKCSSGSDSSGTWGGPLTSSYGTQLTAIMYSAWSTAASGLATTTSTTVTRTETGAYGELLTAVFR